MGDRHLKTPIFWKAVIGLVAVGVLLGMAGGGATFFVYSQNNNQFCLSCHTLHDEVYQRFQQSKHHSIASLRCHDCHDEPLVAEMTQVAKWMLLRPSEVGPHAPVPRTVCASCHIKENPDSTWQHIISTAGHSVHLQTDTAKALRIECLTCHGVTAHRFVPVAQTCAQSGCHKQTEIRLGKMAGQTSLHCVTCHQFTAPVPGVTPSNASTTNAALAQLVPGQRNCLGCHEMQKVIERFVPENDPHKGQCGACHNPHTQTTPAGAFKTCENAGCHARPDTLTPFHRGIHATALSNCGSCHQEHTWKVRGKDCIDCHQNIYKRPPKAVFRPPQRSSMSASPRGSHFAIVDNVNTLVLAVRSIVEARLAAIALFQSATNADSVSFSHATHRGLACTSCHSASGPAHGSVTLRSVRDCQQCHHGPTVSKLGGGTDACLHCHQRQSLPARPQTVAVKTSTSSTTMSRTLPFAHATHSNVSCAECHTTPVTLAAATQCSGCHANHHAAARNCATCHNAYDAHRDQQVHMGCAGAGCHSDRTVLSLGSARNVCLSCHAAQVDHKPGKDCGTCHRVQWAATGDRSGDARTSERRR
jgi:hypothetical protein